MTEPTPKRILVAYDFSSRCREAWNYARELARRCGSTVEAVHARSWFMPDGKPVRQALSPRARRQLLAALARQIPGARRAGYHVAEGSAVEVILDVVRRRRIGLLVLAAEGASAARRLARGSMAEALMGQSPVPVVTFFERWRAARSMLAPLDHEKCSASGLERLAEAARGLNARLTLMHVAADRLSGGRALTRLERLLASLSAESRAVVRPTIKVVEGEEAARSVAEESSRHGLIALLTGRASRAETALGAVAGEILRLSHAPVMAVPDLFPSRR